jgi:hypothetical protein
MFKTIQKYQTADGVTHDTSQKAEQHVETVICDVFARALMSANKPGEPLRLSAVDSVALTEACYQNRATIRAALALETFGEDE